MSWIWLLPALLLSIAAGRALIEYREVLALATEWEQRNPGYRYPPTAYGTHSATAVALACLAIVCVLLALKNARGKAASVILTGGLLFATTLGAADPVKPAINLDEGRAFGYLEDICKLGRRPSESEGMAKQQELLIDHFTKLGAQVGKQEFNTAHPKTGVPVRMTNLIVSWHPQAKERVLLCCHYDTRPYPDEDEFRPKGTFIGANDGGSGVALFMEMGHSLPGIRPTLGVDMVFFDGEEFIFQRRGGKFFLGSEYFARQYRDRPPPYRYVCGVLVDMIGDKKLTIPIEPLSQKFAPKVVRSVWDTARTLGIKEFVSKPHPHDINDDHVPLNEIAKIPTADLIDFDYPHWHTTNDLPKQCSGASLVKVGRVLLTWLQQVPEDVGR